MLKGATYFLILILVGVLLAFGSASMMWERFEPSAYVTQLEPVRPGQESALRQAVFNGGHLWLLSDAGRLWSVEERTGDVARPEVPGPIVGLCANALSLVIVTDQGPGSERWAVHRLAGSDWLLIGEVEKAGEGLVGLVCDEAAPTVITSRRLVSVDEAGQTTLGLATRIPARPISTVLSTPSELFVGLSEGEFGGGLMVAHRRTGVVRDVASNTSGELCGGPLNPQCDPVNGLAVSPWKPDCVVAAIGLMHIGSHGRLIDVCGEKVSRLYVGPCPYPTDSSGYSDGEPYCTEPLHGLASIGSSVVAVGTGRVISVGEDGTVQRWDEPRYERYGLFEISFGPDVIFVMSSASRRASMGPDTPLLVARR